jgi:hypothetical protein
MRRSAADSNLDVLRNSAMFEDFARDRYAYLFNNTQDVALCGIGIGAQDKVRRRERIEVRDMAMNEGSGIV